MQFSSTYSFKWKLLTIAWSTWRNPLLCPNVGANREGSLAACAGAFWLRKSHNTRVRFSGLSTSLPFSGLASEIARHAISSRWPPLSEIRSRLEFFISNGRVNVYTAFERFFSTMVTVLNTGADRHKSHNIFQDFPTKRAFFRDTSGESVPLCWNCGSIFSPLSLHTYLAKAHTNVPKPLTPNFTK